MTSVQFCDTRIPSRVTLPEAPVLSRPWIERLLPDVFTPRSFPASVFGPMVGAGSGFPGRGLTIKAYLSSVLGVVRNKYFSTIKYVVLKAYLVVSYVTGALALFPLRPKFSFPVPSFLTQNLPRAALFEKKQTRYPPADVAVSTRTMNEAYRLPEVGTEIDFEYRSVKPTAETAFPTPDPIYPG